MDPSALLAIVFGFGFILVGNALEGGHLSTLLQPTAALIVLGGTTCATWLSSTPDELRALRRLLVRVLRPGLADRRRTSADLLRVSGVVRRDGMLAAEALLPELADDMLRRGLQLLVDGTPPPDVRAMLELEAEVEELRARAGAKLLESAGGYAPTIGILGAVLGLIHVMRNMTDAEALGAGIAVAFVATLYGVGFANLVLLPLGARLKKIVAAEAEDRAMVILGIAAVVAGANARQIGERLAPFAEPDAAAAEAA